MARLNFDAHGFLPDGGGWAQQTTFEEVLGSAPSFTILQHDQTSSRLNVQLALTKQKILIRLTGGCGNMAPEYWQGMQNVVDALCGYSADGSAQPKFAGLGLFGGTRMLRKDNITRIRPGVTEIFPAIVGDCPGARVMGIVGQVSKKLHYMPFLLVSDDPGKDYFTVVHQRQHAFVVLTQNQDQPHKKPWDLEVAHSFDICNELIQGGGGWQMLLLAYNGGNVTRDEVHLWAEAGSNVNPPGAFCW